MKVIEIRKAGPGKPNVWLEAGNNDFYYYKLSLGLNVFKRKIYFQKAYVNYYQNEYIKVFTPENGLLVPWELISSTN